MESKDSITSKTITLKSSDGVEFVVPEAAAMQSGVIRRMIEDDSSKKVIPLAEVNAQILAKVIDYCQHRAVAGDKPETKADGEGSSSVAPTSEKKAQEELSDWDKEFLDVSEDTIHDLSVAAHYLAIKGLLYMIAQKSEDTIEEKSFQELCQTLNFDIDDSFHDAIIELANDDSNF